MHKNGTLAIQGSSTSTENADVEHEIDEIVVINDIDAWWLPIFAQAIDPNVQVIFWSLAFASAVVIAAWMISAVWQKYLRSPVIVSFQPFETKTSEIPFPAITICNMNKILKSKADNFMRLARGPWKLQQVQEARENVVFMDHVCAATSSFSKRFNFSVYRGNVPDSLMNQIQSTRDKPDSDTLDMTRFLEKVI
ncbi:unnamed protein product [Allacma fusca]|uniref:Uncharacterized protein n=1 Tax=Allacma fusca TaxID=39272 RepID=A0A8J2P816_9HEXA|nr:unnamed protein product [Allacma fusca]